MAHVAGKSLEKSSKMNQNLHVPIPNNFEEDQHSKSIASHPSIDLLSSFGHKLNYSSCYGQRNYKGKKRITWKETFQPRLGSSVV